MPEAFIQHRCPTFRKNLMSLRLPGLEANTGLFFIPIHLCSLNGGLSAHNYALIAAKCTDLIGAHLAPNYVTTNPLLTSEHSHIERAHFTNVLTLKEHSFGVRAFLTSTF